MRSGDTPVSRAAHKLEARKTPNSLEEQRTCTDRSGHTIDVREPAIRSATCGRRVSAAEEGGERVGARATYVSDVGQAEQLPDHGELAQEREDDGEEVSVREVGGQLAGLGSGDDVEGGSEEDAPRENRRAQ